ncbi:MAG TPA: sulfatase-like hydrolase/transferase [Terracidiphilus sp.]|nr:sulfatase-like hydrolase/transferase [Terracidiphilus sp.]
MSFNRREFLVGTAAAAAQAGVAAALTGAQASSAQEQQPDAKSKPNIVIYHSDQFRWDFVGANGLNSSTRTPNLDALVSVGTNFNHAVTNQPVCAPSRSVLFTGCYATNTGVWHNGLGLREDLPTIATSLRAAGYTANYIGKWHLAPGQAAEGGGRGPVKEEHRGGFLDLWEASNALEFSTHPYEGTIWDRDGNPITFKDEYRVDFLTDRAERFLRQKHEKPFLLVVSQLEPHQQNDLHRMVGPKGSAERFINAFVPADLRAFPGDWHEQLPDYYGACEAIDASVGRVRKVLEEEGLAENTIFVFMSDHGCHFMTRNQEYKRSTHNSSLRVPLIIAGPGFEAARPVQELVGIVSIAPTLLDAVGVPAPGSMQGKSFLSLLHDPRARADWPNAEFVQISESMTGRAVRTRDWTYCVADPTGMTNAPTSTNFHEYQLYDQRNDPHELVNLAGRKEYRDTADALRDQLKKLMVAAGETEPDIVPAKLYP